MDTMTQEIMLYNTLTRQKEKLQPQEDGVVRFYSCGQTVYDNVHVGNAKTYIVWDILVRALRHFGYTVKHIQNFTDVGHLTDDADEGEDKIVKRAKLLKEHPMELVDRQINDYYRDMDRINIARPNLAPRATAHITEMIDLVQTLLDNGHAYELDGSIYYDISTFDDYGKLARLDLENLKAGARIEVMEGKRNPGDFALWIKAPTEHIMKYSSPWGKGYPGWHLECSVMSMKYLGDTLDIHAGGIDHLPVHHTNEIAQSEGATGKQFAKVWLHSEFITINGEKMSKSKGNFVTLQELIEKLGEGPAKIALSKFHYRTQADFSWDTANSIRKRYFRLIRSYHIGLQTLVAQNQWKTNPDLSKSKIISGFERALADDLNTPLAYTQIDTAAKRIDQAVKAKDVEKIQYHIAEFELMMDVLGVTTITVSEEEVKHISGMVVERTNLRESGNLELADKIRNLLQFENYVLQDQADGSTVWYKEKQ